MARLLTASVVALGVAGVLGGGGLALGEAPAAQATTMRVAASAQVARIQARLAELGYLPQRAVSGRVNARTRQAVIAFQGWEGLARDGIAGTVTRARLAHATPPRPLLGRGRRVEIHLARQVALLVRRNRVVRAIHVSTGASATPTPLGRYRVFRKERESWSVPYRVWLPWASYFDGGIALHGYREVPTYPASHGCVRVPLSEARVVYRFTRLGFPVRVLP